MTAIEFNHEILGLQEYMKNVAFKFTPNREDARDLIQETYFKVIKHKDMFDPSTNLKVWIFTIMRNTYINKYRKEKRAKRVIDYTVDHTFINNSIQSSTIAADADFNLSELEKMLSDLDEGLHIPFRMHFHGFKYHEIAEHLNLTMATVKNRIFFCRKRMMEKLEDIQN